MMAADRRRINGPAAGTTPPVFSAAPLPATSSPARSPSTIRKIFLKTSLTPAATGSAFLELSTPSCLKLTASVYGPRPLPPSAAFSPNARVTAELKFAPFSSAGERRGYVRDALERDLSAQLQTALARSVRVGQYPKSGIDVFVTVLDCEDGPPAGGPGIGGATDLGNMVALAGAINCAAAAIADAGIECVDLVSAGVAATAWKERKRVAVLDPSPADGWDVRGVACVGYMAARDELTLVWTRGELAGPEGEERDVVDSAVEVAAKVRAVLNDAVKERLLLGLEMVKEQKGKGKAEDVEMSG